MNTAIPLETICFINSETYEDAMSIISQLSGNNPYMIYVEENCTIYSYNGYTWTYFEEIENDNISIIIEERHAKNYNPWGNGTDNFKPGQKVVSRITLDINFIKDKIIRITVYKEKFFVNRVGTKNNVVKEIIETYYNDRYEKFCDFIDNLMHKKSDKQREPLSLEYPDETYQEALDIMVKKYDNKGE